MSTAPAIALSLRVDAWPARGERRDSLDQAWVRLVAGLGYRPVLVPNAFIQTAAGHAADVFLEAYLRPLGVRGVILTGGNDLAGAPAATDLAPERDATERALLAVALRSGWPVLGVCRGMQFIVQELGGELVEVAHHVATLHPIEIIGEPCWLGPSARVVNSFHRLGVRRAGLPSMLEAAALAPDGVVEAVRHRTHPVHGIQWHPERAPLDPDDAERLAQLFAQVTA